MSHSVNQAANAAILAKYLALKQPDNKIQVTYVWTDGRIDGTKAKSRTVNFVPEKPSDLPIWSRGMVEVAADGNDRAIEGFLKPVVIYPDPFRGNKNILALCECLDGKGNPTAYNTRSSCESLMSQVKQSHDPWFGIEQEYTLFEPILGRDASGSRPLGWPINGCPPPVTYDCMYAVGADLVIGREIYESHYRCCLYAGIEIFGESGEVRNQWEYQIGPCAGVTCADDLWMSRHIMSRLAEEFRVSVSFDPIPGFGCPSTGAHTNFSTRQTRDKETGMDAINDAISKLSMNHDQHMLVYDRKRGEDNKKRLTGGIVFSNAEEFTSAIGDKKTSVRIPQQCADNGCGYIEDRRPASNCDPYVVTEAIVKTCCLD